MSIYKKMVEGEGDMIGHIAYSRYIAEKILFIESFKEKKHVDKVPQDEIERYEEHIGSDNFIENYRFRATSILQKFLQTSFNKTSGEFVDGIKKEVSQHIEEEIAPKIDQVKGEVVRHINEQVVSHLPKTESLGKRLLIGSIQSMGGALIMYFLIWFFANVVGKFEIGNISVEYKDSNKAAQQEQVDLPKDSLP